MYDPNIPEGGAYDLHVVLGDDLAKAEKICSDHNKGAMMQSHIYDLKSRAILSFRGL